MGEGAGIDLGGESVPYRIPRYRLSLVKEGSITTTWDRQLRRSRDVVDLMLPVLADLDREAFWVILLDGRNRATGLNLVSLGSLSATLVHPREVFKPLVVGNAAAAVLVHNHPSGDPTPSGEDIALTRRLCEVGDLIGIRVIDHVVIGNEGTYRSLADDGLLGGSR